MRRFHTPLWLGGGAAVSTALGFALGVPWILLVLGAAVPFAVFAREVRRERYREAWLWVLFWAVFQSVAVGIATGIAPDRGAQVVLTGPEYAAEMMHWIRTGEGPEGSPRLFLPIHLKHYLGFSVLSLVTLGGAGLVLGTLLLNYMNFYVAELIRASADPVQAAVFGWPIWAAIRVAGFVATGVAMAAIGLGLAQRLRRRPRIVRSPLWILTLGVSLVILDAVLKALLAPVWQGILLRALDGTP